MKITKLSTLLLSLAAGAVGCGDDKSANITCGDGTTLMGDMCVGTGGGSGSGSSGLTCGSGTMEDNGMCVPATPTTTYVQVEQLARPGLNEALLITDGYLSGYNAAAPTFAGVDAGTLGAVVGEAKTVLKAVYLGVCFLDGVAGLTPDTGLKPAGLTCNAVGANLLAADGETQTAETIAAASAYADAVFKLFIPDTMRIDTNAASGYFTLCGTGPVGLCGGRLLTDDVIDDTYNFLFSGGAITPASPAQFRALVADGVGYSATTTGAGQLSTFDTNNKQQGHPDVLDTFPYGPVPY